MRYLTVTSVLAGLLVASCSTRTNQPAPVGPEPPPAVATPIARASAPAPTKAEDATIPDECTGGELDLATLAAFRTCDLDRAADMSPAGLHVSLDEHQLTALSGGSTQARLQLTNTMNEPLAVELDASCGFGNIVRTEVYSGKLRLDEMGTECEPVIECSGHAIGVVIDPGQSAFIRVEINASAVVSDSACERFTGRALVPGTYAVAFDTALAPEPLVAELTVRELELLPTSRCEAYAKKLAALAEPIASLRPEVARQVAASCTRSPPPQALVDCQLDATNVRELAECTH